MSPDEDHATHLFKKKRTRTINYFFHNAAYNSVERSVMKLLQLFSNLLVHSHLTTTNTRNQPLSVSKYQLKDQIMCKGDVFIRTEENVNVNEESDMMMPPDLFRKSVREGTFAGPTNGVCPGYIQCNLVVLRQKDAFDFLLFCQRNKQACPLIEVLDVGSYVASKSCNGSGVDASDLRTDIPKYRIYRHGMLDREVSDATEYWPEDSVAFLIGCSFSTDGALMDAGIRLRSVEEKTNVPMFNTNIPCQSAGRFSGNLVVSMKPIKALDIAKEVEITSKFPHAHGAPVCVGCPASIGIKDVMNPDFGDAVVVMDDELPVFHACGVTPQMALLESRIDFAITHSPGYMLVTDLPVDEPLL